MSKTWKPPPLTDQIKLDKLIGSEGRCLSAKGEMVMEEWRDWEIVCNQLQKQNTALQANNTKLVLRVRELEKRLAEAVKTVAEGVLLVTSLATELKLAEQDGKRLDWLESDERIESIRWQQPHRSGLTYFWSRRGGPIRQEIDKGMSKEGTDTHK